MISLSSSSYQSRSRRPARAAIMREWARRSIFSHVIAHVIADVIAIAKLEPVSRFRDGIFYYNVFYSLKLHKLKVHCDLN